MIKILILMIGLATLTTSCSTTSYYHQKYPILSHPARPVLSEEARGNDDVMKMVKYAIKLEIAIDAYNKYAKSKNDELDEALKEKANQD